MFEPLSVTTSLTDDKVHFKASVRANPGLEIDYSPPVGTGDGYLPLELFLASLAACSGATIAVLLRRMHRTVDAFDVHARGVRREEHPTAFERIDIDYAIASIDITSDDMEKAIRLSSETYCPVWSMIHNDVHVSTEYRIERREPSATE
jgi:putative redox protein